MTLPPGAIRLAWHGLRLALLPDRAIWLPDHATLLLADVHLGKPASFRARGVPVPEAVTHRDLDRMSRHLRDTAAERLIILGDLIHDRAALEDTTCAAVRAWRDAWPTVAVDLVPGNHDRHARSCEPLGVRVLEPALLLTPDGPVLTHEPPAKAPRPTFCGHLHPVVSLGGHGPARLRTACFWLDRRTAILPAFGSFTGGCSMAVRGGELVFAAGDRAVIPVTREAAAAAGAADAPAYDRA